MNERIQELAEHAGLKVESWMTNPPKPFQILGSAEDFDKFAELIVRECASIAAMNQAEDMGWNISEIIKEHFGVEE